MKAIGDLNEFVKYQMGRGVETGAAGGAAGAAAEMAVGFGVAQQIMQQAQVGPGKAAAAAEILSPADVARILHVSESDVVSVLLSGQLKGKQIGATWRITRAALDAYLAG
jgi:excisionase family DNA binding protein